MVKSNVGVSIADLLSTYIDRSTEELYLVHGRIHHVSLGAEGGRGGGGRTCTMTADNVIMNNRKQ